MPSPDRFEMPTTGLGSRLRERPFALAAGALVCGALLGGLVVYQPSGSMSGASRSTETTGSGSPRNSPLLQADAATPANGTQQAAPSDNSGAVDCDQQTWPYLSQECAEHKRRSLRVVTTDRLAEPVVNAIESPKPVGNGPSPLPTGDVPSMNPSVEKPASVGVASAPPPAASLSAPATSSASAPAPASKHHAAPAIASAPPATAVPPSVATPLPPPAAPKVAATPAPEVTAPPPAALKPAETKASKPAPSPQIAAVEPSAAAPTNSVAVDPPKDSAKTWKRKKAKSKDRSIEADSDSNRVQDGDRVREAARIRESDRSRDSDRRRDRDRTQEANRSRNGERDRDRDRETAQVVERAIEREYDVPSHDRSGRRKRVIVIERDNGRIDRDVEHVERGERRGGFFFGDGGFPFRF